MGPVLSCRSTPRKKFLVSRILGRLPSVIRHLYVIFVFLLGWCLFWITDSEQLLIYLSALFGVYGLLGEMTYWQIGGWSFYALFVIAILASTPVVPWLRTNLFERSSPENAYVRYAKGIGIKDVDARLLCDFDTLCARLPPNRRALGRAILIFVDMILIILLVVSVLSIVSGSFSPVIYAAF